ncbi:RimJ/RimL family protein N-acetyltransferase [Salirhabdus euzebyi]|uniref:RimJ/RimL family protein N-acetyltransferase n=1 Tax=Salirhabdus euzebyi TaxID=394506 RepID=A0A841PYT5_9BACI|nr:GNAT family N-acetyltransferase [Salirhabdus euzebyi]MBB6452261.1 RimJ/RimL family protein N-acetyltransferase [Salirhabdus euzebyi]
MQIREIKVEDAENFSGLVKQVESETNFMLMEAGERRTTPEQQQKQIELIQQQRNSTIFVAEQENLLVGYLIVIGGRVTKTKHSAYLVIGILEEFRGVGIGTRLFQQAENWARKQAITRLELTVVKQNEAGVALYKKSGFEIEGTKRNSLMIDGTYVDEYYMSKLL